MKEGMLESQIVTLQEPQNAVVVDARGTVEDIAREIRLRVSKEL
jgi:gluconate kinase